MMDSDQLLHECREALVAYRRQDTPEIHADPTIGDNGASAERLADAVAALDERLSNHGQQPYDWQVRYGDHHVSFEGDCGLMIQIDGFDIGGIEHDERTDAFVMWVYPNAIGHDDKWSADKIPVWPPHPDRMSALEFAAMAHQRTRDQLAQAALAELVEIVRRLRPNATKFTISGCVGEFNAVSLSVEEPEPDLEDEDDGELFDETVMTLDILADVTGEDYLGEHVIEIPPTK